MKVLKAFRKSLLTSSPTRFLIVCLVALFAATASGSTLGQKGYWATDWAGTNLMNQNSSNGVLTVLGVTNVINGVIAGTGILTNFVPINSGTAYNLTASNQLTLVSGPLVQSINVAQDGFLPGTYNYVAPNLFQNTEFGGVINATYLSPSWFFSNGTNPVVFCTSNTPAVPSNGTSFVIYSNGIPLTTLGTTNFATFTTIATSAATLNVDINSNVNFNAGIVLGGLTSFPISVIVAGASNTTFNSTYYPNGAIQSSAPVYTNQTGNGYAVIYDTGHWAAANLTNSYTLAYECDNGPISLPNGTVLQSTSASGALPPPFPTLTFYQTNSSAIGSGSTLTANNNTLSINSGVNISGNAAAQSISGADVSSANNIDAQSYTVGGLPFSFIVNQVTSYYITGAVGTASSINGTYLTNAQSAAQNSWTNQLTGARMQQSGGQSSVSTTNAVLDGEYFKSGGYVGAYVPFNPYFGGVPTNQPICTVLTTGSPSPAATKQDITNIVNLQFGVTTNNGTSLGNQFSVTGTNAIYGMLEGSTNNYGLPLKADANGNISGTKTYGGRSVNEGNLPHFWTALNSNNAVRVLCMGDSTMTWNLGGLSYGLMAYFRQFITVPFLNYITVNDYGYSANVAIAPGIDTNWFCSYAVMPPNSGLTNNADAAFFGPADIFRFAGIAYPHGGKIQVEAHTSPTSFTVVATISLSNSVGYFGVYTNIPVSGNVYPVITSLTADTGSSNFVLFCVQELSQSHSLVVYNLSNSGQKVMAWLNINTNITYPVINGLGASVIIFNQKNSQGLTLSTNIGAFDALFKSICPNADIAWTTTHPAVDNVNWDIAGINEIEYTNALMQGDFFCDTYSQCPPTNVMNNLGWFVDSIHLSTLGATVVGGMLAREMMRDAAGVDWTANGGLPYLNVLGNVTFGNNLTLTNEIIQYPYQQFYSQEISLWNGDTIYSRLATRNQAWGCWNVGFDDSQSGNLSPDAVWQPLGPNGSSFALPGAADAMRLGTNGNLYIYGAIAAASITTPGAITLGFDSSSINTYALGTGGGDNNNGKYATRGGTYGEWFQGYEDTTSGTLAPAFTLTPLISGGSGWVLPGNAPAFRVETNGNAYIYGSINPGSYNGLPYRSGITNFANLAISASTSVVFSTPFTPGTIYSLSTGVLSPTATASMVNYSAATTNGFTETIVGVSTGTFTNSWLAWPLQ